MSEKKDLEDELIDFELMLEGILADETINESYKERILSNWYSLSAEIKKKKKDAE